MPAEQNTEHKRRESIGHDQFAHFRFEKAVVTASAENEHKLGDCQLQQDDAENEKNARVLRIRLWLVDPQLRDRSCQKQQRDNEVLGRFGLLAAENKKSQSGDETGEDNYLYIGRGFQAVQ